MNKFNITPEFAEELGAYLEGKLLPDESCQIENLILTNEHVYALADEACQDTLFLSESALLHSQIIPCDNIDNFSLPEIGYETIVLNPNNDGALDTRCAMMDDCMENDMYSSLGNTNTNEPCFDEHDFFISNFDDLTNI